MIEQSDKGKSRSQQAERLVFAHRFPHRGQNLLQVQAPRAVRFEAAREGGIRRPKMAAHRREHVDERGMRGRFRCQEQQVSSAPAALKKMALEPRQQEAS
jgi:hypothetical protein